MHRFAPPSAPADFDLKIAKARAAVKDSINGRQKPAFAQSWGQFKAALSAAQFRKCAFCEAYAVGVMFGDVEHYRPKSEIEELGKDPATWGRERPNLATVEGRKTAAVSAIGYWWHAYAWDNYLLACTICNQQWKKAIFPVREQPRRVPPDHQVDETPLLLNPFFGPDPKEHLEFGRLGEVKPRGDSVFGFETIRTCGLDRPSLREFRIDIARRTHRRIDELSTLEGEGVDRALRDIYDDGKESAAHCGMVRAIYEQRTATSWYELEQIVALDVAAPA